MQVIYAEHRHTRTVIKKRGDMTEEECVIEGAEWVTRDKNNFVQAASPYMVTFPHINKKGECEFKKFALVDLWLKWSQRATYDHIVWEPRLRNVGPSDFNMWSRYLINYSVAERFVRRRGLTDKQVLKAIAPWLNHLFHIVADGRKAHFEYQQSWFSAVLHGKKTGVAMFLMSDHGAGKSIVAEMYALIMGSNHACTLTKGEELTGTFNEQLAGKTLVISEEATYGGSKKDMGFLKNIITAEYMNVRPMYQPLLTIKSNHNLLIISNKNRHVIPVEPTERRYACFNCNPKYAGIQTEAAKAYFQKILAVPPQLIAYFYYFIYKNPSFNPRADIPVTACTMDQKVRTIGTGARFLLVTLQLATPESWARDVGSMPFDQLYMAYLTWCDQRKQHHWARENIHAFVETVKKHLLVSRRFIGTGGLQTVLTKSLAKQRLKFATSMGLSTFPMLGQEVDSDAYLRYAQQETPEEDDESKAKHESFMDVVLASEDGEISENEKEQEWPSANASNLFCQAVHLIVMATTLPTSGRCSTESMRPVPTQLRAPVCITTLFK